MNPKIMTRIKHYGMGLLAASWNGGISSVAAIFGIDAASITGLDQMANKTGDSARFLNTHEMVSAFVAACVIHGILWLKAHPIPETYEDTNPPIPTAQ